MASTGGCQDETEDAQTHAIVTTTIAQTARHLIPIRPMATITKSRHTESITDGGNVTLPQNMYNYIRSVYISKQTHC